VLERVPGDDEASEGAAAPPFLPKHEDILEGGPQLVMGRYYHSILGVRGEGQADRQHHLHLALLDA
jgi:hypothetical protein